MSSLAQLVHERRVIVCCGAGGVGKTSISCALALGAARAGRRVLAMTIDPSRRLAQALGVARHSPDPVAIDRERLEAAGVQPPGDLAAWMLDPQSVSDDVVRRFSKSPADAERLMRNNIYRNVTTMVAGMQEYTAVEAMHEFVNDGRYDLVVLDTPPSRNALHFLDAPSRITRFLDGRVFRFFLPGDDSLIKRATSKITSKVMEIAFGAVHRDELMTFFALFSGILRRLSHDAAEMREFFRRPDVSFLLVTSPSQEALEEAAYFEHRTRDELELPLSGYVLNRSLASSQVTALPDEAFFAGSSVRPEARAKLRELADHEAERAVADKALLAKLRDRLGDGCFAESAPYLADGVSDLPSLARLCDALLLA